VTVPLPPDIDQDKLAEAGLAILSFSAFHTGPVARAWKGLDWDLTDLLYKRGWIENPVGKAKSIVFTEAGMRMAPEMLQRHFGLHGDR
jgi:hypothetical protein